MSAWEVYFASLCSFYMHPGNKQIITRELLEHAAHVADMMVEVSLARRQAAEEE